jgi:hypothetical protein
VFSGISVENITTSQQVGSTSRGGYEQKLLNVDLFSNLIDSERIYVERKRLADLEHWAEPNDRLLHSKDAETSLSLSEYIKILLPIFISHPLAICMCSDRKYIECMLPGRRGATSRVIWLYLYIWLYLTSKATRAGGNRIAQGPPQLVSVVHLRPELSIVTVQEAVGRQWGSLWRV